MARNRLLRINRTERIGHLLINAGNITIAAHEKGHCRMRRLRKWHQHFGRCRHTQTVVADIGDNADDAIGHILSTLRRKSDLLTER